MKLETPLSLQITEQRVLGIVEHNKEHSYIKLKIGMVTSSGTIIHRADIVLDESFQVTKTDTDGKVVKEKFEKGDCQRLTLNEEATSLHDLFKIEQFRSETAYANARKAMKEDDEIAALEAAGVADGWLLKGA